MDTPTITKKTTRRSSIESDQTTTSTKKKSSRACTPCRKKKVKCNGLKPCDRCFKTDSACEYDVPQQKKETPKPTVMTDNHHEARLKASQQFLKHLSKLLDLRKDPEAPLFSNPNTPSSLSFPSSGFSQQNRLTVLTTGQGCYVPDTYLRMDRVPDLYNRQNNDEGWNPTTTIQEEIVSFAQQQNNLVIEQQPFFMMIQENLISIYFQFIDPVIPILHKSSFLHNLRLNQQEPSHLLLNAIYCVSSRWDLAVPSMGEEPRGWIYYQTAINLLDQQQEPKLSTVQALFLLLKYNEHVRRPGFIWRTRYYFQMIVRMCKDLGLGRNLTLTSTSTSTTMMIEFEKRKRTFWAVYCYDVMMSIENGTSPNFSLKEEEILDIPHVLLDEEAQEQQEKIMHFSLLIKIIRNQADIVQFLKQQQQQQQPTSGNSKPFEQLTNELKTTINLLTSTTQFPQKQNMCYIICFLYLASCFATILLHRPFATASASHQNHCTEAAINIKIITELILECNAFEDMYCSIRGIQQIVHYLSAAVTIFKEGKYTNELKQTIQLTKKLALISPATEVIGSDGNLRVVGGLATQHQQQLQPSNSAPLQSSFITTNTTTTTTKKRVEKRKSLHFPTTTSTVKDQQQQDMMVVPPPTNTTTSFNRPMMYASASSSSHFQPTIISNYIYNNNHISSRITSNTIIDDGTTIDLLLPPNVPNHESLLDLLFEEERG